ncbi:MAG: serine hydrolase domain-containing protein [Bacteroidales bacterium]|nr:serine hydrolase domain-containing protein [Bacteroidales bacterium]
MLNSCRSSTSNIDNLITETDILFSSLYPDNEPGAAVLILKGDSVIFEKGYGIANMDSMTPIDGNTFFNIASVSKQFSAVALMMLAIEGRLSLDDNVKRWFPEFESTLLDNITLRHLLSHTSGIPDSRDRSDRHFVTTATDTQSYSYISTLKRLNFEPGSRYEYMNPTFQLMYTIIERSSGIGFDEFMKKRVFEPSGMSETTYFEADKSIPRMSHGYLLNKESGLFEEYDYGEESFFATKADGGIYTSVREFVKWEMALRKNTLIDEITINEAQTPKIEIQDIPYTHYGYGWFIENRPEFPTKIYHTGNNGGFQIYAGRYPQQKILYLLFSNRDDRDREETAKKMDQIFKNAGWL